MRFEIRTGGALLFMVGLAALSGTVFALGLIAGYEMARQNQVDSSQLATNYPLPSPAAMPSPAAIASPAAAENVMPSAKPPAPVARASAAASPVGSRRTASASHAAAPPAPAEESPEEASIPPAPGPEEQPPASVGNGSSANPSLAAGAGAAPPAKVAAMEPPPSSRRHPYNIQIDAVMDNAGARQMADRLRKLGYNPTIVQTKVAGQVWYRIKVGPYLTEAQARAAQNRLRTQYNTAYAGH
ncbi:MAG TPA: SPOR domain-containing protein [Candidatus Binataceae bacterium]|nr:SPOR domain-containing protein [Candidatus Binataceae bacterium]